MFFTFRLLGSLLRPQGYINSSACLKCFVYNRQKFHATAHATTAPKNATLEFSLPKTSKRKNVVQLSPKATEHLFKIIGESSNIVRLSLAKKGCNGYTYDMQLCSIDALDELDEVVHANGVPLLAIENSAIFHLLNSKIDYNEGELESGFIFENPNIVSTCGCGVSFHF